MRRVLVVGGTGVFGRAIVERLRARAILTVAAARRGTDLELDAEDRASVDRTVRERDIVIDAAGPFSLRSTLLLETALDRSCDVIDISDDLGFAERVVALAPRIDAAGVSVRTGCSAVPAVAAACAGELPVSAPARLHVLLAPASRDTASPATASVVAASAAGRIRVWRDGALRIEAGWRAARTFRHLRRSGRAVESALSLLAPLRWPSLRDAAFWVDPGAPARLALDAVARAPALARLAPLGVALARAAGPARGVLAVELDAYTVVLSSERGSYRLAAEPSVLAAERLLAGAPDVSGLVPIDRHVDGSELHGRLGALGIDVRVYSGA